MLFNLKNCLIMHSGFLGNRDASEVERQIIEIEKNERIWIHVVMQNEVNAYTLNAGNVAGASPGESRYPCTSKFRSFIWTALCKHGGSTNVQRRLTK